MGVAAQVDLIAQEDDFEVHRMQRVNERMRRFRYIGMIVALNRLIQKRQANQQNERERNPEPALSDP